MSTITVTASQKWYSTLPKSSMSIITPSGVLLTIKKFNSKGSLKNDWVDNPKVGELIWSLYVRITESINNEIQVTEQEINLFAMYSNKQEHLSKIL